MITVVATTADVSILKPLDSIDVIVKKGISLMRNQVITGSASVCT